MNMRLWTQMAALAGFLLLAGCSNQTTINTAGLEVDFRAAEPQAHIGANKAIAAVHSADYSCALRELKALISDTKLTPEQRRSARALAADVEKVFLAASVR